jgi:hypothetical protein
VSKVPNLVLRRWRSRAKFCSSTLAHLLRWRLKNTGVEKGAEIGSLTLAHLFRWRFRNVGVGGCGKTRAPGAGVSIILTR